MNLTVDKLNEMLSAQPIKGDGGRYDFKDIMPRIEMTNGSNISVQTGHTHYCSPRESVGPWRLVECGFPSVTPPETWKEYFDGDWGNSDGTDSVYGYIPIELVVDFINEHGGIKDD